MLLFTAVSAEASDVNLTIINNTGFTVHHVYTSSPASTGWGADFLDGDEFLEDGKQLVLTVPNGTRWDIRLIDEDGDTYTKRNWGSTTGSGPFRATFVPEDIDR